MSYRIPLFWLLLAGLLLAGCSTTEDQRRPDRAPVPEADVEPVAPTPDRVETRGLAQRYGFADQSYEEALEDEASLLGTRTIYFEFDSDRVRGDFEEVLEAHAAFLNEHSEAELVLEGHTDERGSREYNLGLGERRARAVLEILELNGADSRRIDVISFGEERPVARGRDEESWQLNRRVELLYSGVDR